MAFFVCFFRFLVSSWFEKVINGVYIWFLHIFKIFQQYFFFFNNCLIYVSTYSGSSSVVRHPIGNAIVVPRISSVKPRDFLVLSARSLLYLIRCLICIPCYTQKTTWKRIQLSWISNVSLFYTLICWFIFLQHFSRCTFLFIYIYIYI